MQKHAEAPSAKIDYLETYINLKGLFAWTVGLFVSLFVIAGFVLFVYGAPKMSPDPELVLHRPMNQPALQARPQDDYKAFRAQQDDVLSTYGWVSKQQGIVHIPIERAMEIIIQRGLPARGSQE